MYVQFSMFLRSILNFGEVIVEYFVHKRSFRFPPFFFYYFYEVFYVPVKKEKSGDRHKSKFQEQ